MTSVLSGKRDLGLGCLLSCPSSSLYPTYLLSPLSLAPRSTPSFLLLKVGSEKGFWVSRNFDRKENILRDNNYWVHLRKTRPVMG